jgi:uncharacterized protein YraI
MGMTRRRWLVLGVCGFAAVSARGDVPMLVTGEHVNMRALPGTRYEVVGQLNDQQAVTAKSVREEWVEIVPPPGSAVWIHKEFITENRVASRTLNVRAGPGVNYSVVGQLPRDTPVDSRETFGDWFRIDAPASCSFWVHRDYVQAVRPDPPPPEPEPPPDVAPADAPPPAEPEPADDSLALAGLELIPLEGQGKPVVREGVLSRTEFLLGRPSDFRLAPPDGDGRETICYVRGNPQQLETLLGQRMRVEGREYWAQRVTVPILVPARIILRRTR